jgi:drug/metabolite transporter (DMT)-like permease
MSALGINLGKNIVGTLLLLVILLAFAWFSGDAAFNASFASWGWLTLSGLIGIALGDTCYFRSLQIMGPRRTLMVAATSPLFATLIGWFGLNEYLPPEVIFGIALTVGGVVFVVSDRRSKSDEPGIRPGRLSSGIMLGVLGALCQALGGVFSKIGMADCSPMEATFIRIFMAGIFTCLLVGLQGELKQIIKQIALKENLSRVVPATIIGTVLGIWFSQIAFKNSDVAVAITLLSSSPLFAIPMVFFIYGQKTTVWTLCGTILGLVGIYLVVNYQNVL